MTMTDVQDKSLKSWRPQNSKDEDSVKANYDSLCRSLFGNDIKLPENPKYHYLIPEYTTNPVSSLLGQQNIDYVRQRQPIADLSTTSDSQQQPHLMTHHSAQQFNFTQYTTYPLSLDAPHPYANLEVMKPPPDQDQDSGYVSQGRRELAPPPPDTSGYIDPRDIQNPTAWQHVGHSIAMAGAFSQGTIEMPAPFEMDYELENPEDPSS
ncbi:hypothetical protein GGR58DRAFT_263039 [Xylaria digitata]|nr:hypothetical protein GGR58DRAFT_263039 [Xylaria digitata]